MFSRIFLLCVLGGLSTVVSAQDLVVKGHFVADTIRIGQPTAFVLTAHYPSNQAVVFPDSTYSYQPFELHHKVYFPTRTNHQISVDSAVYYLNTFEIDSLQSLSLPVFLLHGKDSSAVFGEADTILLKQLVGSIPPSVEAKNLPLKSNADYLSVKWLLNYPLLLIIGGIFLVLLVILWFIFGKRIRKYYKAKRLQRKHLTFRQLYTSYMEKMKVEAQWTTAESALVAWKKYMEGLVARPYTKQTTREILRSDNTAALSNALRRIDQIVYARQTGFDPEAFRELLGYTEEQFNKKTEELKHG